VGAARGKAEEREGRKGRVERKGGLDCMGDDMALAFYHVD